MEEVWKDVCGYEGRYQVSNCGRVRSLNYRGTKETRNLVPKINNCGRLWVDFGGKCYLVHRLVATAFIENSNGYPEINHKDENPQNNVVSNLEWCTGEYNKRLYSLKHPKTLKRTRPIYQMSASGEVVRKWKCSRDVTNNTGMNQWSIIQCCEGNRKTAYGFRWQYAI